MPTPTSKRTTPSFQFYPDSFLSSSKVERMSMTERGIYITFLARCWQDNGLPTDMKVLAGFARMKPAQFERVWKGGALSECFYERNGKLHNERLDKERKKQAEFRRRQSDNAARGWRSRGNAVAVPEHQPSGITRAVETEIESSSGSNSSKKKEEPLDVAFQGFQMAYPEARRKGGFLAQQAYISAVERAGSVAALFVALANHKASEQWSNPKHIPGMDVWLREERWRQVLPPAGPASPYAHLPEWARKAKERELAEKAAAKS